MSEQQDKTFVRTFIGVIAFMVALTIVLIVVATSSPDFHKEERAQLLRERASERLQPVGAVRTGDEPLPTVAAEQGQAEPMSGQQVTEKVCAACHNAGTLGAPKIGAAGDWQPRMEQGLDQVVHNAINGLRAMPPKGGDSSLSEDEVREAVIYMLEESGINVE